MTAPTPPRIALTIAGSDSGGGAGIQADLKTFHAFGVFGTSVVTAITAQNTRGVTAVHAVPMAVVRAQIEALAADLPPRAFKTGMLATAELVREVARAVGEYDLPNYVLDPVMVATSGDRLLDEDAEAAVAEELVPLATLVTPNLHEAGILTGRTVDSLQGMRDAASELVAMGARAALVKGGHLQDPGPGPAGARRATAAGAPPARGTAPGGRDGPEAVDVLRTADDERVWRRPRIATDQTHGTGCTLSAAAAAGLARGDALPDAVDRAVDFVARAIAAAPGLGSGRGPVNHFVRPRPAGS